MEKIKKSFLKEVRQEYKNVNWPSKEQVVASTGVVLFFVFVMSAFLFGVDVGIMELINLFLDLLKG